MNDIPMMLLPRHHGAELYERGVAQINRLRQKSAMIPRVLTISVHRIAMYEKLLACVRVRTGAAINDWYRAQAPAPV